MPISNKVRTYKSTQTGMPQLKGLAAGELIAVLDAVLCNGVDTKAVTSIVVTGGIAVTTMGVSDAYEVGAVVRVTGATPSGLNSDWRIAEVDGTELTFSVEGTGISDGTATGTISMERAPAGWEKIYSGTNLAAYRSLNHADHDGCVLYVDDTSLTVARTRGYGAMTDISTGTDPFPTDAQLSGGFYWGKVSNSGINTDRQWVLIADDRRFTLAVAYSDVYPAGAVSWCFGRLAATGPVDEWASMLSGASSGANAIAVDFGNGTGKGLMIRGSLGQSPVEVAMPRNKAGDAGAIAALSHNMGSVTSGSNYATATLSDDLYGEAARLFEGSATTGLYRGAFPGPLHLMNSLTIGVAPQWSEVGTPGNGMILSRWGSAAGAYVWAIDLGTDGSWE